MSYQPSSALITGGCGFVGSNFINSMFQKWHTTRLEERIQQNKQIVSLIYFSIKYKIDIIVIIVLFAIPMEVQVGK